MSNGVVKWFSPKKGYGFITLQDGQEVFVHYSAIGGEGFRSLEQGDKVEFEVTEGLAGRQRDAQVVRGGFTHARAITLRRGCGCADSDRRGC